ncbi:MAG: hypothetical protein NTY09_10615 [bacterium]|nr:hypothetical protein [bacterium]
MKEKTTDDHLKRLRKYMAEESKRLGKCDGRVHQIDLDRIEDEKTCAIPAKPIDPMERDLDILFNSPKPKS